MIILVTGIAFWLSQPYIDKDKLKTIAESVDDGLSAEFQKRDKKIEDLEKRLKRIEDTVV